jgi:hypothetical protein
MVSLNFAAIMLILFHIVLAQNSNDYNYSSGDETNTSISSVTETIINENSYDNIANTTNYDYTNSLGAALTQNCTTNTPLGFLETLLNLFSSPQTVNYNSLQNMPLCSSSTKTIINKTLYIFAILFTFKLKAIMC